MKSVYAVSYRGIYAVCTTRENAMKAKIVLGKAKLPNRRKLKIKQVLLNTVYPKTIAKNNEILIVNIDGSKEEASAT